MASRLAEQFARSITLSWESYLNDLFLEYLEKHPSVFLADLKKRMEKALKKEFGEEALKRIHFKTTKPSSTQELTRLLDPKGFNLTFKNSTDFSNRANSLLPAKIAKRFSLNKADSEFFDFVIALRNHLSHGSANSLTQLKEKGRLTESVNSAFLLPRPLYIQTYLKSSGPNTTEHRVVDLANRLATLANVL